MTLGRYREIMSEAATAKLPFLDHRRHFFEWPADAGWAAVVTGFGPL
jgi:hypothetical protein